MTGEGDGYSRVDLCLEQVDRLRGRVPNLNERSCPLVFLALLYHQPQEQVTNVVDYLDGGHPTVPSLGSDFEDLESLPPNSTLLKSLRNRDTPGKGHAYGGLYPVLCTAVGLPSRTELEYKKPTLCGQANFPIQHFTYHNSKIAPRDVKKICWGWVNESWRDNEFKGLRPKQNSISAQEGAAPNMTQARP